MRRHRRPAYEQTVPVRSGGSVTVTLHADVFELSPTDRAFVFSVLDRLAAYGNASAPTAFPSTASPSPASDADPATAGSASEIESCAKGDSNPHGVTH